MSKKASQKGNLKFDAAWRAAQGGWALVRLRGRGRQDRGRDNWLLIKEKDDSPRSQAASRPSSSEN